MSDYYSHEYVGKTTKDGLPNGTVCKIERKWAGGLKIRIPSDQRSFIVAARHVVPKKSTSTPNS